jgi:hypothetical protein
MKIVRAKSSALAIIAAPLKYSDAAICGVIQVG